MTAGSDLTFRSEKIVGFFPISKQTPKRFIGSKRWSANESQLKIRQKRIDIVITQISDGYHVNMNNIPGKTIYPTIVAAKTKVFEFIDSGQADDFFKRNPYRGCKRLSISTYTYVNGDGSLKGAGQMLLIRYPTM